MHVLDFFLRYLVSPLANGETNSEHRLAYVLYKGLWKKGKLADLIVDLPCRVPNLGHSISDEQTRDAQHPDPVARLVDLTKLEGWDEKLSNLLTTRFLIREEYDKLDSFLASVHERGLSRVLLIGQPGIGASHLLSHNRLSEFHDRENGLPDVLPPEPSFERKTHHLFLVKDEALFVSRKWCFLDSLRNHRRGWGKHHR